MFLLAILIGVVWFLSTKTKELPTPQKKNYQTIEGQTKDVDSFVFYNDYPIRGSDSWGNGALGASRKRNGKRYAHKGSDYRVTAGQAIVSPIQGIVKRHGIAYVNSNLHLIVIKGTGVHEDLYAKVLYISPTVPPFQNVKLGDIIGYAQSLQSLYPNITEHIHFELWKHAEKKSQGGILLDPKTLQEVQFNYN